MAIFGISDLHLSLSADKPMDVFKGWDNYVERLTSHWNRSITDDDVVVIPGDISWALKLNDAYEDFNFLNSLPGKKIILKGNHDLWWSTTNKMNLFLENNNFDTIQFVFNSAIPVGEYVICGSRGWFFDDKEQSKKVILREAGRLRTSLEKAIATGLKPLVFLHYPVVYKEQVCKELLDVLLEFDIKEAWYGHIHGAGRQPAKITYSGIDFHLITCDSIDFSPIIIRR